MSAEHAGEPYHCALCGTWSLGGICRPCRVANTVAGKLVPWAASLAREADRLTKREKRRAARGVSLVSLEALG